MTTETSVVLEFMDRSERASFTSSTLDFAKAEETEELTEQEYPSNISVMSNNF